QDLGGEVVVVEDGPDPAHKVHAFSAYIVQTPYEGAHKRGSGFGRDQCLVGRKNQGGIDGNPFGGEHLDRRNARGNAGDFHNDVLGDSRELASLLHHLLGGSAHHLRADGTRDDGAYFLEGL